MLSIPVMRRQGLSKISVETANPKPVLKAAYVEESFYIGENQLETLVTIKSKNELIGDIIALLQSPVKNVVSALQSGGTTIHGVLQTLSENNIEFLKTKSIKLNSNGRFESFCRTIG